MEEWLISQYKSKFSRAYQIDFAKSNSNYCYVYFTIWVRNWIRLVFWN